MTALVGAGVLEPAERLRFVHPLVRTVLYEDVLPAERAAAHARAAKLLQDAGAGVDRVAAQLALAEPIGEPWAVAALHEAAREAARSGSPEVAARYLERALAEPVPDDIRIELVLGLGRAQVLAAGPTPSSGCARRSRWRGRPSSACARRSSSGACCVTRAPAARRPRSSRTPRAGLGPEHAVLAAAIDQELLAAATVSYQARSRFPVEDWLDRAERPPRTAFDRFVLAAEAVEVANRGGTVEQVVELARAVIEHDPGGGHLGRRTNLLAIYALMLVDRFDLVEPLNVRLREEVPRRSGDGSRRARPAGRRPRPPRPARERRGRCGRRARARRRPALPTGLPAARGRRAAAGSGRAP
jgi:hypothetical protein